MWKPFVKLLKAISSNTDPGAIGAAFSAGILLGFLPKDNVLWYVMSIFILFLYIHRGTFILAMLVGSLLTGVLDPVFDRLGMFILTNEKLIPIFSSMLEVPFLSLLKFNNTIVMGSFIIGIILFIPLYYLMKFGVILWRKYAAEKIQKLKVVQIIKKIPLVSKVKDVMLMD